MDLGMIGLGRMGANMVRRLLKGGHRCVVYDRDPNQVAALAKEGADPAGSLDELVRKLAPPRVTWLMIPSGDITEKGLADLRPRLSPGDIVIDGGNSHYKDTVRRAAELAALKLEMVDVGTSGGVWGLERGYCLMIGGSPDAVHRLDPIFRTLAPGRSGVPATAGARGYGTAADGYLHCGPAGSGHFVKMIHNGIEYGLMQAYGEGFDILKHAGYDLDLGAIAELWRRGSVVGSWLLDLTARALADDPTLAGYSGHVQDSGEGRWTIQAAVESGVSANVLSAALFARFRSRQSTSFSDQLLSAMRDQFGGHKEQAA